jgi:uncharacterized repeat protein (TIGR03803 family)
VKAFLRQVSFGIRSYAVALLSVLITSQCLWADQTVLGWDPSPTPDVAGYYIYYGTAEGSYDFQIDVGSNTTMMVTNLLAGHTYFFVARAYDAQGVQSESSNEISVDCPAAFWVDEGTMLTLTNFLIDFNLPPGVATFTLSNAPAGAVIDSLSGTFTWTPTEAQGPSTNTINVFASEQTGIGSPSLIGAKTFTVVVNEVNNPPLLPPQADKTISAFSPLVVTNNAIDPDIPSNFLNYQLINPPGGAVIDANGIISWTPTGSQAPSTNLIQTVVTDSSFWAVNAHHLSMTNSFVVTVLNTNLPAPPSLQGGFVVATLASFDGVHGAHPIAGLLQSRSGNFYGTTVAGGANDYGTIFRMTTFGTITNLVSFDLLNGANPSAKLMEGKDGSFYGTTTLGGPFSAGTIFKLTSNGTFNTLFSLDLVNGIWPSAGIVQTKSGNFFGITTYGGVNGRGTAFPMTSNGVVTAWYSFPGGGGANPSGDLFQTPDGSFYGTASSGGANNCGGIFRLNTNGLIAALCSFAPGNGGANPSSGLVQGIDGNFYGTATSGGTDGLGTVFKMGTNGALTTLFSFNGPNGASPQASLLQGIDGNFYGTTKNGGANSNFGTAFRVTPGGKLTTLISFNGTNGANPLAPLLQASDGSFYGTTANGGAFNMGTVFRLTSFDAPLLHTISQTTNGLRLGWSAAAGANYQVQFTTNLADSHWLNLGGVTLGTGGSAWATDPPNSDPQRFYRVVLLP